MPPPSSLSDLTAVAGTTPSQTLQAVRSGHVNEDELTWVDALVLRAVIPVQSLTLVGEDGTDEGRPVRLRAHAAVHAVREAVAQGDLDDRDAVLIVGRNSARVYSSLGGGTRHNRLNVYDGGMLLALPVGQWWVDLRWRCELASDPQQTPTQRGVSVGHPGA